jgi:hypothetical protein
MGEESAKDLLRDYLIKGILTDIYTAEEAYSLASEIGDEAEHVNRAGFGRLFHTLQVTLSDRQTLSVTRIFDQPHRKYLVRSIPTILRLLEQQGSALPIREPQILINVLARSDREPPEVHDHQGITAAIVEHYQKELERQSLKVPLQHLRDSRDKVIAHNEAVDPSIRLRPTWGHAQALVDFAKDFVIVISWGYLSLHLSAGGKLDTSRDARQSALALRRVLAVLRRGTGAEMSGDPE